jgi:hypothetical protein
MLKRFALPVLLAWLLCAALQASLSHGQAALPVQHPPEDVAVAGAPSTGSQVLLPSAKTGPTIPPPVTDASEIDMLAHIGGPGWAVAIEGHYAYIGVGRGVTILDIADPHHPVFVTQAVFLPSAGTDIVVANGLAYVTVDSEGQDRADTGLWVLDVTDPLSPTWKVHCELGRPQGVAVAGDYAYVADYSAGLRMIDLSIPGHVDCAKGQGKTDGRAYGVAVTGTYAYVADGEKGLQIIDVSSPPTLTVKAGCNDQPKFGLAYDVAVSGNYAYVAVATAGLRIVDISDPTAPDCMSKLVPLGSASALHVTVVDNRVYVASQWGGLSLVDVTIPATPEKRGTCKALGDVIDVAAQGNYAYFVHKGSGLQVADFEVPGVPLCEEGFYDMPGDPRAVAVQQHTLYVADGKRGLRRIDVRTPTAPQVTGVCDTAGEARGVALARAGDFAFVADSAGGGSALRSIELATLKEKGSAAIPGEANSVAVAGAYAYVAAGAGGLQVVSVATPSAPVVRASYPVSGQANDVAIAGGYAYVAAGTDGLRVIDIRTPTAPKEKSSCDTAGDAQGVAVRGNYAYVADGSAGLQVIDVSEPLAPSCSFGHIGTPGFASDVVVYRDRAFVADGGEGLRIIDVSQPASPTIAGWFDTRGYARAVTTADGLAYLADRDAGLVTLDFTALPDAITYLPFFQKPIPTPEFDPIATPGPNINYTVSWKPVDAQGAVYTLQQADDPSFTGARVYSDMKDTKRVQDSEGIMAYYRVKASVGASESLWSPTQAVRVGWEKEPNDLRPSTPPPSTQSLIRGQHHYGRLASTDQSDIFYLKVSAVQEVKLTLGGMTGGQGLCLRVLPETGDNPISPPKRTDCWTAAGAKLWPGDYYVQVYWITFVNPTFYRLTWAP